MMADPIIEYRGVGLRYGNWQALQGISETVYRGDRVVLCGPSGSGKSSLLRCTNGLERFQDGDIVVDGESVRGCRNLPLLRELRRSDLANTYRIEQRMTGRAPGANVATMLAAPGWVTALRQAWKRAYRGLRGR